ncbi:hypothetical protein IF650_17975 [Cellulosimicrobium terreum]|nr:hypothetical protein [Cellulosimicrobium terreum]
MSWDWVPPRPGEENGSDGGPSPVLRRAVTVLAVLVTGAFVAYYLTVWVDGAHDRCVADVPGVDPDQVVATWHWWPPRTECGYAIEDGTLA